MVIFSFSFDRTEARISSVERGSVLQVHWLLIIGRRHLEYVLRTHTQHYNHERPHGELALLQASRNL
jgi:hypothetical protein